MFEPWVVWTLLAATMQALRSAAQKRLAEQVSAQAVTLVRYLFGLPFAVGYAGLLLLATDGGGWPVLTPMFLVCGGLAGLLQLLATVLMIRLLSLRNLAVGSAWVRADIVLTALLGSVLFGESVGGSGWLAVLVCTGGLLAISVEGSGRVGTLWNRSAAYGLGAACAFSLTSLLIRQGTLSLSADGAMTSAAVMLVYMVVLQTGLAGGLVAWRDRRELATVFVHWRVAWFIGLTSVVGSAGWFTAFAMQQAAVVKTLGQVEFPMTLALSVVIFGERPSGRELAGMAAIMFGALLLLSG